MQTCQECDAELVPIYAMGRSYCRKCQPGVFENISLFGQVFNNDNGKLIMEFLEQRLCREHDASNHGDLAKAEGKRALFWEIQQHVKAAKELAGG